MNFDFGEVLARAWKVTWKYKVLWIFGILAGCGSNGDRFNSRSQSRGGDPFSNEIVRDIYVFINKTAQWFKENPWAIVVAVVILIVIGFIQFTLANIGHIGLIRGAYHAEMNAEEIRFGGLWGESLGYFWRVIGLSLAVWGPIWVILIGLVTTLIFSFRTSAAIGMQSQAAVALVLFFISFCCCLFPVMMVLGLYYSQAIRALTLENLGVLDSLKRGWCVFSANFLGLCVMGVALFFIGLIAGIVIAIPIYITVLPLVFKLMDGSVDTWIPVIITTAVLCAYSPVAWILNGVLMTYTQNVWTLIYIRVADLTIKKDEPILIESNA
jgi:hypothetical protein